MHDASSIIGRLARSIALRTVWVRGGVRSYIVYRLVFASVAPNSTHVRTIDPSSRTVRGGGFVLFGLLLCRKSFPAGLQWPG